MRGLMMDQALTITSIMRHAEREHANRQIISVTHDHPRHRYTYGEAFTRTRKLANVLDSFGLNPFDRIGTIAWNDFRHFELYYATSCAGYICHTVNPRLFEAQIKYIINHGDDRALFIDPSTVPTIENLLCDIPNVRNVVILSDKEHMPTTKIPNALCYEELLEEASDEYHWPDIPENSASSLCYTSGTTGDPKGVLYSHRSNVLHSYGAALPDSMGLSARDSVLSVVPMFHANTWGLNYSAPMVGAAFVLPGPAAGDPAVVVDLMETEKVTLAAGVPTVWLGVLRYLEERNQRLTSLERVVVGGSACPASVIKTFAETHNTQTLQAWGMTELSPLGAIAAPKAGNEELSIADQYAQRAKQGRAIYGIEMKITDESDAPTPHDGVSSGNLKVRGHWVASAYYERDDEAAFKDREWFDTGDIATIDPDGFMKITDRTKDVIKSGGEWISSIELENIAIAHPMVAEAAAIGAPHPKWSERPVIVIVSASQETPNKDDILNFFDGKVAKWCRPDDVIFVNEIPYTATGKINKKELRVVLKDKLTALAKH